jgi:vancomycin resistance protein YoaR
VVDVAPARVPPRFSDAQAEELADEANRQTRTPLALSVGGKSATIQSNTVRGWLRADTSGDRLALTVDQDRLQADLQPLVADLGTAPVDASFVVEGDPAAGTVSIVDGAPGTTCCADDSVDRIVDALRAGQTTVTLDTVVVPPAHDRAWAEKLGVIEPIASFTTPHAPGEPRVVNIHRIADLARGMLVEPGATFSVNERIGQRTEEKGFVDAGVIYEGKHTTDIGGGVSQFATTLFNAAFFGGLDLVDYQSHTEYISRYPYGREATISWPKPDLKFENTTPYGVLIWTSYTDTSLTITLYSTKWVSGEQTGQTVTPDGDCDKVTTERTRTWTDGRQERDAVYARYARQVDAGITCW